MHEPIRAKLEAYLGNPETASREFQEHVAACQTCAAELGQIEEQSELVRSLRAAGVEPSAGFYARVMQRIETEARPSVWTILHDTAFGWRLAVASAAMALVMAGYIVSTEPGNRSAQTSAVVILGAQEGEAPENSLTAEARSQAQTDQDRNSVLATLASYRE